MRVEARHAEQGLDAGVLSPFGFGFGPAEKFASRGGGGLGISIVFAGSSPTIAMVASRRHERRDFRRSGRFGGALARFHLAEEAARMVRNGRGNFVSIGRSFGTVMASVCIASAGLRASRRGFDLRCRRRRRLNFRTGCLSCGRNGQQIWQRLRFQRRQIYLRRRPEPRPFAAARQSLSRRRSGSDRTSVPRAAAALFSSLRRAARSARGSSGCTRSTCVVGTNLLVVDRLRCGGEAEGRAHNHHPKSGARGFRERHKNDFAFAARRSIAAKLDGHVYISACLPNPFVGATAFISR